MSPRLHSDRLLAAAAVLIVGHPRAVLAADGSATPRKTVEPPSKAALPLIVVKARPKAKGYVARQSASGTKSGLPLIELPESVSTVTRAQMDALDVQNINDALAYTSGVATSQRGGDADRYDQLTIRGFQGTTAGPDQYLDDLKLLSGAYYAIQQVDPFLLDEVDVAKGPASILYGESSPGGIIAESSKLPTATPIHSIVVEAGNMDLFRGAIDLGGAVTPDGRWTYRFAATGLTAEGEQNGTAIRRYAVAPAISWNPDDLTTVTLLGRYQRDPAAGAYSSGPETGTVKPDPLGALSNDFYSGDYSDEIFNRTQSSIGYILDRTLTPDWHVHLIGRYTAIGADTEGVYSDDLAPGSDDILPRGTYGSKENVDTLAFDDRVNGTVWTGPVKHNLLIGAGYQQVRDTYDYGFGTAPSLDVFEPVYGLPIAHPPVSLADGQTISNPGVYAQDEMSIGHVRVQFGGREDWVATSTRNDLAGGSASDQFDRAFTFRGGLAYVFDVGVTPYFNYAQSFEPQVGTEYSGAAYPSTRGEQYEVGVKYQPRGWNSFMSAALYNLTQNNVLEADPAHAFFSVPSGTIRSRGLELEAHASLARGLDLIGSYTVQDVNYVAGSSTLLGYRPLGIPAVFASVWLHYTQRDGRLAGLGGGLGVRVNGNTNVLDTSAPQLEYTTHGFNLVDAQLEYALGHAWPRLKGTSLQLNATNLLNTQYVTSCYPGIGCFLGLNRTIIGQVRSTW